MTEAGGIVTGESTSTRCLFFEGDDDSVFGGFLARKHQNHHLVGNATGRGETRSHFKSGAGCPDCGQTRRRDASRRGHLTLCHYESGPCAQVRVEMSDKVYEQLAEIHIGEGQKERENGEPVDQLKESITIFREVYRLFKATLQSLHNEPDSCNLSVPTEIQSLCGSGRILQFSVDELIWPESSTTRFLKLAPVHDYNPNVDRRIGEWAKSKTQPGLHVTPGPQAREVLLHMHDGDWG
ncbi:uncharacterized protein LAESUDRAFT_749793 [Laetiporus sulphureus 93-53]|uniref:Uncharacterized protein n=1 Tax=Laetiporus sulphureus 93-53 TaxID=1314785 RepID=A0A165EED8_9APHY|nr:uncharacterized protein LAESUDRAFT_749793 [Laetiporus sulphureus 93-53]KZT06867.1 hypothetical protein LAESUDRAFT_749793 [Laetiporus sulphureus 93-53]